MEPTKITLIVLGVIIVLGMVAFIIVLAKRKEKPQIHSTENSQDIEKLLGVIRALEEKNEKRSLEQEERIRTELERVKDKGDQHKQTLSDKLSEQLEKIQSQLSANQIANARETGEIKKMVEEEMNKSISEKFFNAFKPVNEDLDKLNKHMLQMNELGNGIKEINTIFSNIKQTGIIGEILLMDILQNVLPKQLILQQYKLGENSIVDYAIKVATSDKELLLPIDSKFAVIKYKTYIEALESGDEGKREEKNFFDAVKKSAKDISDKYIIDGITTAYAIMYLPSEGIFGAVVKNVDLFTCLYKELKVIPAGPTTIIAIIQAIADLYKTAKITSRANMIVKMINNFVKDFDKVLDDINDVQRNLEKARTSIEKLTKNPGKMKENINAFGDPNKIELLES